jgi:23S rRNA pseudouridine2605 synthase
MSKGKYGRYQRKKKKGKAPYVATKKSQPEVMRLNKYISRSGICSRRDADQLIADGKVTVDGEVITEMGTKVKPSAEVVVDGKNINPEPFVYILMYKPHDTITTTNDEKGRRTVMDFIENATGKRVYPVGRLDRNTTGVLLLTNDGELANRLMHPSYETGKLYEIICDRPIMKEQMDRLKNGVELDDGKASAYFTRWEFPHKNVITIGVHEGRYHMVRRMIEAIGAEVKELKRTNYAGLTLKGLRPGRWRYLRPDEINNLRKSVKLKELKISK